MTIRFTKLQATGNDFILIDARAMRRDWHKLARAMCHRHFGIGSDGLILLKNSRKADFAMRMINPDGSEAEVCGNGLRCFAKYVVDSGLSSKKHFTISTLAGIKQIEVFTSRNKVRRVKVNMGAPHFKAEEIPVLVKGTDGCRKNVDTPILDYPLTIAEQKLALSFVSMGNPHAVHFVNGSVNDFPLREIGPNIEHHQMFPERINFEVARVINPRNIEARVWERGAEETLACGSGACAIAVAARLKGYTGDIVDIMLSGGELTISWDGMGDVYLTGTVEEVFCGEWLK